MSNDFEVVYETPTTGYDFVVQCRYEPDFAWSDDARFKYSAEANEYAYDRWFKSGRLADYRVIRLLSEGER